ncbi:hypothetical protein I4U23_004074 [Adineta vaga]|nr:hypothetical protein I4U23_004074 [Adineta vaga]
MEGKQQSILKIFLNFVKNLNKQILIFERRGIEYELLIPIPLHRLITNRYLSGQNNSLRGLIKKKKYINLIYQIK